MEHLPSTMRVLQQKQLFWSKLIQCIEIQPPAVSPARLCSPQPPPQILVMKNKKAELNESKKKLNRAEQIQNVLSNALPSNLTAVISACVHPALADKMVYREQPCCLQSGYFYEPGFLDPALKQKMIQNTCRLDQKVK